MSTFKSVIHKSLVYLICESQHEQFSQFIAGIQK